MIAVYPRGALEKERGVLGLFSFKQMTLTNLSRVPTEAQQYNNRYLLGWNGSRFTVFAGNGRVDRSDSGPDHGPP